MKITYSDFWLTRRTCQGEPYFIVSTQKVNDRSKPITYKEAKGIWHADGPDFTDDATDWLMHLMRR